MNKNRPGSPARARARQELWRSLGAAARARSLGPGTRDLALINSGDSAETAGEMSQLRADVQCNVVEIWCWLENFNLSPVYLWCVYGVCTVWCAVYMVCVWCVYSIIFLVYGVFVVCVWYVYSVYMVYLWCVYGKCMVSVWCMCVWCNGAMLCSCIVLMLDAISAHASRPATGH